MSNLLAALELGVKGRIHKILRC